MKSRFDIYEEEISDLWGLGNSYIGIAEILIDRHNLDFSIEYIRKIVSETIRYKLADKEIVEYNVKLAKQKQKLSDLNRIQNKSFREHARLENALVEYNQEIIKLLKKESLSINEGLDLHISKKNTKDKAALVVQIADTHFNELVDLEHNQYDVGGGGFHRSIGNILLEDQTTDVSNTTYTRNVITYDANADVAILSVDSDMTERTFFSANSTGGAVSGECSTFEISFQVKDIDSVAITNTSVRNADAEVDELSRFNNIDGANTVLSDTQLNTLLFPVPDRPLQLANNITYTFKDTKTLTTDSGGVVTFSLSGTDTFTDTGTPISSSIAEENFIVVVTDSGTDAANSIGYTPVTNGQYLSFSNTDGISRTINVTSTSAVIDCNTTAAIGISVAYTAKKNSLTGSGKTKAIVGESLI